MLFTHTHISQFDCLNFVFLDNTKKSIYKLWFKLGKYAHCVYLNESTI